MHSLSQLKRHIHCVFSLGFAIVPSSLRAGEMARYLVLRPTVLFGNWRCPVTNILTESNHLECGHVDSVLDWGECVDSDWHVDCWIFSDPFYRGHLVINLVHRKHVNMYWSNGIELIKTHLQIDIINMEFGHLRLPFHAWTDKPLHPLEQFCLWL